MINKLVKNTIDSILAEIQKVVLAIYAVGFIGHLISATLGRAGQEI